jgi:hypothetical protein
MRTVGDRPDGTGFARWSSCSLGPRSGLEHEVGMEAISTAWA